MKTRLIQIGNSRGIRIPKAMLEQAQLTDEVQIDAAPNQVVIRSLRAPREGWDEAFRRMAKRGDDALIEDGAALSRVSTR